VGLGVLVLETGIVGNIIFCLEVVGVAEEYNWTVGILVSISSGSGTCI
jgi:hypothetical protein